MRCVKRSLYRGLRPDSSGFSVLRLGDMFMKGNFRAFVWSFDGAVVELRNYQIDYTVTRRLTLGALQTWECVEPNPCGTVVWVQTPNEAVA